MKIFPYNTFAANQSVALCHRRDCMSRFMSSSLIFIGSACFFSWGLLTFLSPVVIGVHTPSQAHMEFAYFASQAAIIAITSVMIGRAHIRRVLLSWRSVILCGIAVSVLTATLVPLSQILSFPRILLIGIGLCIGMVSPPIGIAWGSRFTLSVRNAFICIMGHL